MTTRPTRKTTNNSPPSAGFLMGNAMQLHDTVTADAASVRRTADGYLTAEARVARTGIQMYRGAELGMPDRETVRVYRPEDSVFSQDAMHSYAYRPMTNDHPSAPVDAENWRDFAIGQTGGDVVRDGEFVRVPLVMMDAQAIADFEAGKRELSMGYDAEIVFQDGTTESGEKYDAIQKSLRMNHVALVDRARGGNELRIGDRRAPGAQDYAADNPSHRSNTMSDVKTKTILVDGLSVETTDAGAQAIEKLQQQVKDAEAAQAQADEANKQAIAAKDAELATKDAEIDDLKGKQLSDADLDAKVKERADLISDAKSVADQDYNGLTPAEIRKAAVKARCGDAAVTDKSDAYIEARFDVLKESGHPDPVRSAVAARDNTAVNDNGQSAYEDRLSNAWKGNKQEVA